MNDYVLSLMTKYRTNGILIDTNILLLFIVGSLDPDLILRFSRTTNFSIQDFQIVAKVIDFFETKITTPHILTEVSNLIDRYDVQAAIGSYAEIAKEIFTESSIIVSGPKFSEFGLTDSAILSLAKHRYLVVTNDGPLIGFLQNNGVDVIDMDMLNRTGY